MKLKLKPQLLTLIVPIILTLLYLLVHLVKLTALPVFADESIYIRWAQLIIDDWRQYLFFPLNDGKTPMFVWLLVPFQLIFSDPLLASRFLSVLAGAIQLWVMKLIAEQLGFKPIYQCLTMLLTAILPFWFFHHHMALMEGLLTLFLSLTLLNVIKLVKSSSNNFSLKTGLLPLLWAGFFFGLSILTKIPAILFLSSLIMMIFIFDVKHDQQISIIKLAKLTSYICISILIGLGLFLLLKLHPAFGQLFSRGNDFLFSWQEILLQGKWHDTLKSWPNYISYFSDYLTFPVMCLAIISLLAKNRRMAIVLHLGWMVYALPIFLLGRTVYPRYLFEVSIFITLAAVLGFKTLWEKNIVTKLIAILLILISFVNSVQFISPLLFNPSATPFVSADRVQYLTEWSAGFGVKETVELILSQAKTHSVLVLSEGYFGTLPDGLLMYLHNRDVTNLFVTGIGQPINELDPKIITLTKNYDQTLLVANSHRININLDNAQLLFESCRPFNAPCHQVWDITKLVSDQND